MKKLLLILTLITSSAFASNAKVFRPNPGLVKAQKDNIGMDKITVSNKTKNTLYLGLYTVSTDALGFENTYIDNSGKKHKVAALLFSNIYEIKPEESASIERPNYSKKVDRNLYFSTNSDDMKDSLADESAARKNKKNVGEGFGKVIGKGKNEFDITQGELNYIAPSSASTIPTITPAKPVMPHAKPTPQTQRTISITNALPASTTPAAHKVYAQWYTTSGDKALMPIRDSFEIDPDKTEQTTIPAEKNVQLFFWRENDKPTTANKPISFDTFTDKEYVIYPVDDSGDVSVLGQQLKLESKKFFDRFLKTELEG